MSLVAATRAKMLELEQEAAFLDRTADYDADKIMGFFVKALGPGGKTFDLQIDVTDTEAFQVIMSCFDTLMQRKRNAARTAVSAVLAHA